MVRSLPRALAAGLVRTVLGSSLGIASDLAAYLLAFLSALARLAITATRMARAARSLARVLLETRRQTSNLLQ